MAEYITTLNIKKDPHNFHPHITIDVEGHTLTIQHNNFPGWLRFIQKALQTLNSELKELEDYLPSNGLTQASRAQLEALFNHIEQEFIRVVDDYTPKDFKDL